MARPAYFATARDSVQTLIGNELAMQKRINLSVQMPDDDKSVLPVHADVWSGDSAFEAVLWVPFVDVFATKSMFIASPAKNAEIVDRFQGFQRSLGRGFISRGRTLADLLGNPLWPCPGVQSKPDAWQPRQPRGGNAVVDELPV